ncbi:class E sortase [Embleya sp. NPDC055664]|uniref:class E sortase n=1 Tax=Embleya sp. NPDC059237 TaxID=3346784 RepID=UPI0036C668B9
MRGLGEVFITLGVVILLFVVYQLYWTGVLADRARADEMHKLDEARKRIGASVPKDVPVAQVPAAQAPYEDGEPFGTMYIPRFGDGWYKTIRPGVTPKELQKGLGWYKGSAQAGQDGNFAIAGHRKTYGDPFLNVPKLQVGDKVVIEGITEWFVYSIDKPVSLPGDKAVLKTVPEDVHVLDPVPAKAYTAPGKYITLTTCEPEFGSTHRLIVWGHLESRTPLSSGRPAALQG